MFRKENDLVDELKKVLELPEQATVAEVFVEIGKLQERAGSRTIEHHPSQWTTVCDGGTMLLNSDDLATNR